MERRLAAILAADMVSYSRLMEADEEETHRRFRSLRVDVIEPMIATYHGRIVKLTGDGVLVEFPSVVQAATCAVEIQRDIAARNANVPDERQILFRIGINLGDVIIEEEDIYGSGVNLAARLEALAEPGGICIARNVYDQIRDKVDYPLSHGGEHRVKNIAEPVEIFHVGLSQTVDGQGRRRNFGSNRMRRLVMATAIFLILATMSSGWWLWSQFYNDQNATAWSQDTPSIAVLPFRGTSDVTDQDYFSNGLTDDLTTDLSEVSGLLVIASNSSYHYKEKDIDPTEIGRRLGVQYLLDGSVRRVGDRVRINAQLIDAATGGQIWANRYDGSTAEIFDLQDQVTGRIVEALTINIGSEALAQRERRQTNHPEAYDAYLRGWEHYRKRTPQHYIKALAYFERATELDPDYALAFAAIASVYWRGEWEGWHPMFGLGSWRIGAWRQRARENLEISMAKPTTLAHAVAGHMRLWEGKHDEALIEAENALTMDPNNAEVRALLAEILIHAGEPKQGLTEIAKARRLDPHNEGYYSLLEGFARFSMEEFDVSASLLARSLELSPELWPAQKKQVGWWCYPCPLVLAANSLAGHEQEVAALRERFKSYFSVMTINDELSVWFFKKPEDKERFANGLRQAGIPEN
ncbi:MAG: tetratricopeptide repeat protein [Geminicoccaceae bacterium]